jgi:hypothetical protein
VAVRPNWAVANCAPPKEARANYVRLKVSGPVVEATCFEKPVWTDGKSNGGRKSIEEGMELTPEQKAKNRKDTAHRVRGRVADLARCNFQVKYAKFVTLTFRDGAIEDVTDSREAIQCIKTFIQRMRWRYGGFRYLWAMEYQDTNGRGAVHYHMLMDIQPKIPLGVLNQCWSWGGTHITAIRHVTDLGKYLVKYVSKTIGDLRRGDSHLYGHGQGMNEPEVFYGQEADAVWKQLGIKKEHLVSSRDYETEYQGQCHQEEYNLSKVKIIPAKVSD